MDEKASKPPAKGRGSKKRVKREQGNPRERERSFIKQRMAVLRPHDEPTEAASTPPPSEREDTASQQDTALPIGLERQKLIAQYRRRQQQREDATDASTDEEQTEQHTSSPCSDGPQEEDDDESH